MTPFGRLQDATRRLWPGRVLLSCGLALLLLGCGSSNKSKTPPATTLTLPQIALAAPDLDGGYHVQSEQYLDDDAQPSTQQTKQYRRSLVRNDGSTAVADVVLLTISDSGVDSAEDFIESAQDDQTGPPNLQDYIANAVPGATNVHATPDPDFPSYDDATVANQLTWQQTVNGTQENEFAYGVYVRQQGVLAFIAVRAVSSGGAPEGLRAQAEEIVKKQADRLKQGAVAPNGAPH